MAFACRVWPWAGAVCYAVAGTVEEVATAGLNDSAGRQFLVSGPDQRPVCGVKAAINVGDQAMSTESSLLPLSEVELGIAVDKDVSI